MNCRGQISFESLLLAGLCLSGTFALFKMYLSLESSSPKFPLEPKIRLVSSLAKHLPDSEIFLGNQAKQKRSSLIKDGWRIVAEGTGNRTDWLVVLEKKENLYILTSEIGVMHAKRPTQINSK